MYGELAQVSSNSLTLKEIERYSRQIMVFGIKGQKRLKKSKVLIVGVGGLGSIASFYLVAAGIGELNIVDSERVELSNLNRQILFNTQDIGKYKAEIAKERLLKLNPNVVIKTYNRKIDEELANELIPKVDVIVDALDNWKTRILLNKYCVKYEKPLIHAGVSEYHGQLMVIVPKRGPCLQCVFPQDLKERRPFPILGPVPGVLGALEALEVIKLLTGDGEIATGKLLIFDGKSLSFKVLNVRRNPQCPVCGENKSETLSRE